MAPVPTRPAIKLYISKYYLSEISPSEFKNLLVSAQITGKLMLRNLKNSMQTAKY
jgi:hypothetical protein